MLERLTKPSFDEAPDDEGCGQRREGEMDVGPSLVAGGEATELGEPRQGALDDPPVIRSIIERIERIEEEVRDLNEAKKEIFDEAKGEGLDVEVLKEILKIRKQDKDERDEQETLLDVYMRAMDAPSPVPLAEAA